MKNFFQKKGFGVVVFALLLTAAVSILTSVFPMDPVRDLLGIITSPVRALTTGVAGWGAEVWNYAAEHERLRHLGVRFVQEPTTMGPVVTAVLDDTCGNLIQIASAAP